MRTRAVLVAVGWLVVAGAAATTATVALNTIGAGILGASSRPRTPADIHRELAADRPFAGSSAPAAEAPPGPAVTPTGTPTSTVSPPPRRILATDGGTVVAQCAAGQVTLLSWSPAQGYRTDGVTRGPAPVASIKFKAANAELLVTVRCAGAEPVASVSADDHGGSKH
jgi:hypothetical protein